MRSLIPEFVVDPADLDEEALVDADPWVTAQRLAREKAFAVFERHPESLVLAGDTVVAVPLAYREPGGFLQLSKPIDAADAARMLGLLQGRSHKVITGVAIRWPAGFEAFTETATVHFRPLTPAQIEEYVATGEPMDKAGAYGAQGMAGLLIDRIEGDFETVVGFPVRAIAEALRNLTSKK